MLVFFFFRFLRPRHCSLWLNWSTQGLSCKVALRILWKLLYQVCLACLFFNSFLCKLLNCSTKFLTLVRNQIKGFRQISMNSNNWLPVQDTLLNELAKKNRQSWMNTIKFAFFASLQNHQRLKFHNQLVFSAEVTCKHICSVSRWEKLNTIWILSTVTHFFPVSKQRFIILCFRAKLRPFELIFNLVF